MISKEHESRVSEPKLFPGDWLFHQRAYPEGTVDTRAYGKALAFRQTQLAHQQERSGTGVVDLPWIFSGPTNIGGRITDIERTTTLNPSTLYVGSASGGIFKTLDEGKTWIPIFDDATNLSIGDIALAPSNEQIIYVGTGEPNAGGGSIAYDGDGVYKSIDGGTSWAHLGLPQIGSVGRVIVHPTNPDKCYVGSMGHLFENNADRGLYRTNDGGENWEQILFINDSTGIIDMVIHPEHPDTMYAAAWERVRRVNRLTYGGPSSGIYRTYDGGDTWQKLTNGLPATAGRMGLAISASNPNILALFCADENTGYLKGIFQSKDGGDSWPEINSFGIDDAPFMYWFGRIIIDPVDPQIIYVTSLEMFRTTNGGQTWEENFNNVHADQHVLWIDPQNPASMYLGNDGGLYYSTNRGDNYIKKSGLPITQFYTCEIDYSEPDRLYGGTQDNNPMRTLSGDVNDWETFYGGDGFCTLVDPSDNTYIYTEYQYGNMARSVNGGVSFAACLDGISPSDRKNWNTPFILHPNDPSILYYGSNKLYRSDDRAASWTAISPDLTGNPATTNLVYGTITSISVSPLDDQVIFVGTDVGRVQVSVNGGGTWKIISDALPNRWVTNITADPDNVNSAYVTLSGYRYGSKMGHIFKTVNMGLNWMDISGNFPDIPINDFVVIPDRNYLVIATDIGVYYSEDGGVNWEIMGSELPNVIITDLTYHDAEEILVAASYGRGLYTLDLTDVVNTNIPVKVSLDLKPKGNPFNQELEVQFSIEKSDSFIARIIDMNGRIVSQKILGEMDPGSHQLEWDAANWEQGVYICSIVNRSGTLRGSVKLVRHSF